MIIRYSPSFIEKLKKGDVRIRKSLKERILLFSKNPLDPQLRDHPLKEEFEGYRSINITSDWRAIYQEIQEGNEVIAYFIALGPHGQLYK